MIDERNQLIPSHKAQVRIRTLVSYQVLFPFQSRIQHLCHTYDFFDVAFNGAGDLLGVEVGEPGALSKVGSLARGLEVKPLGLKVFVGRAGGVKFIFWVIVLDEVLDYGTRLPQSDVRVGVDDGGNSGRG